MIAHLELGDTAFRRFRKLKSLIDEGKIQLAAQAGIQLTPEGIAQQDALQVHQKVASQPAPQPKPQGGAIQ